MAKTLTEAAVTTRNARSKLPIGVHFKGIDPEVHLGYRKGRRGGVWFVRWRAGQGYRQAPLGVADDELREGTLDYNGAVQQARKAVEAARKDARAAVEGSPPTVRSAVEAYIAERDMRLSARKGRPVKSDAASRLELYVLGREKRGKRAALASTSLADKPLHALSEGDLLKWKKGLPAVLKATAKQRTVNDLKAALNDAYAAHRHRLDANLVVVIKHGLKVVANHDDEAEPLARENQILTDAQITQLLGATRQIDAQYNWEGDLYRLIVVLAATGARFSQIVRMRVGDVQRAQGRLLVPASRKGTGAKSGSTPVAVGKDIMDALLPATTGRAAHAPLLERWRHKPAPGGIKWTRAGRGPWLEPSELQRPWEAIREIAENPAVIPYAFRHSSIVRGIKAGLPIRLVAAMHNTSVQMIERHYSRWIVDGLEELAARAVVPLLPQDGEKVVTMRART